MPTIKLISMGKISSALPRGLVLDSDTPTSPNKSRVVIKQKRSDNLQSFYYGIKSDGDQKTGFLATYDLKYVLVVSNDMEHGGRVICYREATGIANGGQWPSWITDEMLFRVEKESSKPDLVRFWCLVSGKNLVMDVAEMVDKEGTVIIAYPRKDGVHQNQLFRLENPLQF